MSNRDAATNKKADDKVIVVNLDLANASYLFHGGDLPGTSVAELVGTVAMGDGSHGHFMGDLNIVFDGTNGTGNANNFVRWYLALGEALNDYFDESGWDVPNDGFIQLIQFTGNNGWINQGQLVNLDFGANDDVLTNGFFIRGNIYAPVVRVS
jgi:hypothetical protein